MIWYEFKLFLTHVSGISMDALHVVAGVLIQMLAAAMFRSSLASWRPWFVVLGLELLNEAADLWIERWPHPGMQFGEGAKDILLTMFLPTLLLMAASRRPDLFRAAKPSE